MRIDVVTIFPDYLAPLELSLPGKARDKGLLDLEVHDLRRWTHDRHRTVDDTPYGGGAGMVMKPEPWGEALDAVAAAARPSSSPRPAGSRSRQALARELATQRAPRLRVRALRGHRPAGHRARRHARRGAGGLAGRLRPQRGRGRRAGDHRGGRAPAARLHGQRRVAGGGVARGRPAGVPRLHQAGQRGAGATSPRCCCRATTARIAAWRREQAVRRTAERRPDLLPRPGRRRARRTSTYAPRPRRRGELYTLQRACWLQEMEANPGVDIPALRESLDDVRRRAGGADRAVVRSRAGRLVGSRPRPARPARRVGHRAAHGRPRPAGPGPRPAPAGARRGRRRRRTVTTYVLFTGAGSDRQPADVQEGRATGCGRTGRPRRVPWC